MKSWHIVVLAALLLYLPIAWQDAKDIWGNEKANLHPFRPSRAPYKIYLFVDQMGKHITPVLLILIIWPVVPKQHRIVLAFFLVYHIWLVQDYWLYQGKTPGRNYVAYTGIILMILYRIHLTYKRFG